MTETVCSGASTPAPAVPCSAEVAKAGRAAQGKSSGVGPARRSGAPRRTLRVSGANALSHPKLQRAGHLDRREALELIGFVMLCGAWAADHRTDAFVPEYVAEITAGEHTRRLTDLAVRVGMLGPKQRADDGDRGWPIVADDGLLLLHTRARRGPRAGEDVPT